MTARALCATLLVTCAVGAEPLRIARPRYQPMKPGPFSLIRNAATAPGCTDSKTGKTIACDPNTMLQVQYFGGKVIPNAKVYAVFLIATGLERTGWTIFILAYLVSFIFVERTYSAGKAKLRTIGWFARLCGSVFAGGLGLGGCEKRAAQVSRHTIVDRDVTADMKRILIVRPFSSSSTAHPPSDRDQTPRKRC